MGTEVLWECWFHITNANPSYGTEHRFPQFTVLRPHYLSGRGLCPQLRDARGERQVAIISIQSDREVCLVSPLPLLQQDKITNNRWQLWDKRIQMALVPCRSYGVGYTISPLLSLFLCCVSPSISTSVKRYREMQSYKLPPSATWTHLHLFQ